MDDTEFEKYIELIQSMCLSYRLRKLDPSRTDCQDRETVTQNLKMAAEAIRTEKKDEHKNTISIEWCGMCRGFFVRCPRCGNNSCNGGYGEEGKCPVCPKVGDIEGALQNARVYDLMQKTLGITDDVAEQLFQEDCKAMGLKCSSSNIGADPVIRSEV